MNKKLRRKIEEFLRGREIYNNLVEEKNKYSRQQQAIQFIECLNHIG